MTRTRGSCSIWPLVRCSYTLCGPSPFGATQWSALPMERRLAAILAADVQGYSRLTELNEEASTATLRMYRAVVEESISAHRGHIFSSAGDGVVAEFPSIVGDSLRRRDTERD